MITTAIIGASGYSGAELLRLLLARDDVAVRSAVAHGSAGKRVDDLYPALSGLTNLVFEPLDVDSLAGVDVAFVALPSGEAMKIIPRLRNVVDRIIDLGGDFRLPSATLYEQYYRRVHSAPDLLGKAVYGLPELNKYLIAGSSLVANPGCYPTSAILALLPALRGNVVHPTGVVINSLSGVSGAGRSEAVEMSFVEINESVRAYKVGVHQHLPEIETVLSSSTGKEVSVSFVPHLVPITRGIYTTIHANLIDSRTEEDVIALYREFYANAPFVRVRNQIPRIKDVVYTNFCDIRILVDRRTHQLIVLSAIDNLGKGAAGQAIQNMNIMFGLPDDQGFMYKEKHYVQ